MSIFGGGAASGSGSGTGATAYTPTAQPQADTSYQNILAPMINTAAAGAQKAGDFGATGVNAYARAEPTVWNYTDPAAMQQYKDAAQSGYGYGLNTLQPMNAGNAAALSGAANQVLSAGFDPQRALYNQGKSQLLDQSNAINAMYGLSGTPYGASVASKAMSDYDLGYQKDLLNRESRALTAAGIGAKAGSALGETAGADYATYGGLPYNIGSNIATTAIGGNRNIASLGDMMYNLPQQTLNDLQSYLGLGQSASLNSANIGQMGFNQTASGIGGLLSLLGSGGLFGSGGAFSAGGLFGSQGPLFGTAADLSIASGGAPLALDTLGALTFL